MPIDVSVEEGALLLLLVQRMGGCGFKIRLEKIIIIKKTFKLHNDKAVPSHNIKTLLSASVTMNKVIV